MFQKEKLNICLDILWPYLNRDWAQILWKVEGVTSEEVNGNDVTTPRTVYE